MTRCLRWPAWVVVLGLASCQDPLGPGLQGRWAARGIELRGHPRSAELRLPCAPPLRVTAGLAQDSSGAINLAGRIVTPWSSSDVAMRGTLRGDTLLAVVTLTSRDSPPLTLTHVMVPDGDPAFGSFICLV